MPPDVLVLFFLAGTLIKSKITKYDCNFQYFKQKRSLLTPPLLSQSFKNNLLRKMQLRLKTSAAMHPNNYMNCMK